jgi:hypothetical protein
MSKTVSGHDSFETTNKKRERKESVVENEALLSSFIFSFFVSTRGHKFLTRTGWSRIECSKELKNEPISDFIIKHVVLETFICCFGFHMSKKIRKILLTMT